MTQWTGFDVGLGSLGVGVPGNQSHEAPRGTDTASTPVGQEGPGRRGREQSGAGRLPLEQGTRRGLSQGQERLADSRAASHQCPSLVSRTGWEASCQGSLRLSRVQDKRGAPSCAHTQPFAAPDPRGSSPPMWLFPDVRSPGCQNPGSHEPAPPEPAL